jgi:hypothetical protein
VRFVKPVVAVLIGVLFAWLGVVQPLLAVDFAPASSPATYSYNGCAHGSPSTHAATDRGPPAAYDRPAYDVVDRWSRGASARAGTPIQAAAYTYDYPAPLMLVACVGTTTQVPGEVTDGRLVVFEPSHVAANTGRVFSSADAHVADAANAVEAALPGRVVGVNGQRTMANGLTREVDIDLGNLLIQVKSGNARGLTGQIGRTQSSTGVPTVGYAPGISDAAWRNAASQGVPILRSPGELLACIREFG